MQIVTRLPVGLLSPLSTPRSSNTGGKLHPSSVSVDWLSFSWDVSAVPVQDMLSIIQGWMPHELRLEVTGRGKLGFKWSGNLVVPQESGESLSIGLIAWGGEHQRGRALCSISGTGCQLIPLDGWVCAAQELENLGARLTRLDLAADDIEGQFSVDTAATWYQTGQFGTGGNVPSVDQRGNWLTPDGRGRTLYVGKAKNGKVLCVYEKGKQLGDVTSPWVRWELRLGNKDRVIPFCAMVDRAEHFAGGYSCLQRVVDAAAQRVRTARLVVEKSLSRLVFYARRSYGRLVSVLLDHHGGDAGAVCVALRSAGVPASLAPAWRVMPLAA